MKKVSSRDKMYSNQTAPLSDPEPQHLFKLSFGDAFKHGAVSKHVPARRVTNNSGPSLVLPPKSTFLLVVLA